MAQFTASSEIEAHVHIVGGAAVNIDFSQLSFLLVEDSAYMRGILRAMLQGFGARRIHEAEDGASGLETLERVSPDILILDWVIPVLDGAEMVRLIRQPSHPQCFVPIIMVTAHTEKNRMLQARNIGVHEVLCKPISAKALHRRIASVVLQPREFVRNGAYFGPKIRESISARNAGSVEGAAGTTRTLV